MRLAIAAGLAGLVLLAILAFWPPSDKSGAVIGVAASAVGGSNGEPVVPAARDVTSPRMLPGPVVDGPLRRVPVAAPPPAPPRWRRFFRPFVLEAGLIDIGGRAVRLPGIAILPADALCHDAHGAVWPCGREARTSFRRLIRGRAVECRLAAAETSDPLVAPCRIGAVDLALWLAEAGWARPEENAGDPIQAAALAARCAGRGLWRDGATEAQCPDSAPTATARPGR